MLRAGSVTKEGGGKGDEGNGVKVGLRQGQGEEIRDNEIGKGGWKRGLGLGRRN